MKKTILFALIFASAFIYTSCSKDPVKPEEEHNHDDAAKTVITFFEGHYHGSNFHKVDSTIVAIRQDGKFIDAKTNALIGDGSQSPVVELSDGELQKMTIQFIDGHGHLLNGEFLEEANTHQMFFIPSVANVLNYTYKDATVGFDGDFEVLQTGKDLNLLISLRHGLNKIPTKAWNDADYYKYGSEDFKTTLRIKTIEGSAHEH